MPKYRKGEEKAQEVNVLGMLHILDVRLVKKNTGEKIKHKLLMVGCEAADIERKLRWVFDAAEYAEMSIKNVEKVREKIHTLSTVITQERAEAAVTIKRKENTQEVSGVVAERQAYNPNLYAIGIATTMLGEDEDHALRKVGRALIARTTDVKSHGAPALSDDAVVNVEQVPKSSGFARARDTSNEVNNARFVRG